MMQKTVGFLKVTEEQTIRVFSERPQDDKDVIIPIGIYEVVKYDSNKYSDYSVIYTTSENEERRIAYYDYEMDRLKEEGKYFSVSV
jgi:hypothetical protein